jgi:alpha-tubulin suppressor-like RCC1 family protein
MNSETRKDASWRKSFTPRVRGPSFELTGFATPWAMRGGMIPALELFSVLLVCIAFPSQAQTILQQPQNTIVAVSSNTTLSVLADGTPPLSYQWSFSGSNLDGATTSALQILNAQASQSGLYRVSVSNIDGVITSAPGLLSVVGIQGWGLAGPWLDGIPFGVTNASQIVSQHGLCFALTGDGRVLGWGLGDNGITNVPSGTTNAISVCANTQFAAALLNDGTVSTWGNTGPTPAGLPPLISVAATDSGTCFGLKQDGTVIGWSSTMSNTNAPNMVTNVVRIVSGGDQHIALRADGTIVNWNDTGQGDVLSTPQRPDATNVIAIAAAEHECMVLRSDGSILVWGSNTNGQDQIPSDATNLVSIAVSDTHCVALKSDGTVVAWGTQNGVTPPPLGLPKAMAIAASDSFSLILLGDGAPHLTVQPWHRRVRIGGPVSFTAKAVGTSLSYQWKLNGNDISGATSDTYAIPVTQASDSGFYSLVVSNELGSSTSQAAQLTVVYAQTIQAPVLPSQPNVTVNELSDLIVTNTATDVWVTNLVLSYQLIDPPAGAAIDAQGIIRWRPSIAQAPSTNLFTTVVTDNGSPSASATNQFVVTVLATTSGPVLELPDYWVLRQWRPFFGQVQAIDPGHTMTFSLGPGAPDGASISADGMFSWTPLDAGTNHITVIVADSVTNVSGILEVIVLPIGTKPVLPFQTDRVVVGQTELVVTNTATDNPFSVLTYYFTSAPAGAEIDANGIIRWTPAPTQEPSTNEFVAMVLDITDPSRTGTNSFTVIALASNRPPVLDLPPSWTLTERVPFSAQIPFFDPDEPLSFVTLSLGSALPDGATLTPDGVFSWEPTSAQAPSTNEVTFCVFDGTSTVCKTVQIFVVQHPPEIIEQPVATSVAIGNNGQLTVVADGIQPLFYQWLRDGTNMPGATDTTLEFTNAQPGQSGFYSVVVSNSTGSVTSSPALFSVAGIVTWGNPDSRLVVPPGLSNVVGIAGGNGFDIAVKSDGTVVCWGEDTWGQMDVPPSATNIISVATGGTHVLALRADGTVIRWGTPLDIPDDVTNVIAIDANQDVDLALRSDGTLVAWGSWSGFPAKALPGLTNIVAISAGDDYNLALKPDGTLVEWNTALGTEMSLPADLTNIVAISASDSGAFALRSDGTVSAIAGPFYNPQTRLLEVPPDLTNVVAISAKGDHGLALIDGGSVVVWGTNGASPIVQPPAGLPNVVAIAGSAGHNIALLRDGAPTITVQPWDRSVLPGSAVSLEAKAVGMQSMEYQWRLNGAEIPGATNDSYSIASIGTTNAGGYTLAVSNRVGAIVSKQALLSVVPVLPPVLAQPGNYSVNAGQTVSFTNSASENNPGAKLVFSLDSAPFGARITSDSGVFEWRPPISVAGTTNQVVIRVTDSGTPPLADTKTFTIWVNPLQPASIKPSVQNGQLHLVLTGTAGPDYVLQLSGDLTHWTDFQTNTPASLPLDLILPGPTGPAPLFYRLRLGP